MSWTYKYSIWERELVMGGHIVSLSDVATCCQNKQYTTGHQTISIGNLWHIYKTNNTLCNPLNDEDDDTLIYPIFSTCHKSINTSPRRMTSIYTNI